jgi:hypothetical protein
MIQNSLLWGVVLIGVGLALALIAYAVMLNRREPEASAPSDEEGLEAEVEAEAPEEPEPVQASAAPAPPPAPAAPVPVPAAPAPTVSPAPSTPVVGPAAATPPPPPTVASGRRLLPVAVLLREDVSGALVVQVADRVYRKADELRGSYDWARVESAAADLARWTGGAAPTSRSAPPARDETSPKGGTMIEQINEILEQKLAAAENVPKGVRLAAGPGGIVRVYIGVQGYSLDEVPDAAVRQLIRQAVAEWEASR